MMRTFFTLLRNRLFLFLLALAAAAEDSPDACCQDSSCKRTYDEDPEVRQSCAALEYCWSE